MGLGLVRPGYGMGLGLEVVEPCRSRPGGVGLGLEVGAVPDLGGTFGRSSREPKYKIEFHSENSPFHPVEKGKSGKPLTQYNTSSMIVETEKRVKLKTPDELLEALKGQCLIREVQEFVLGNYDAEATAAFNQNLSDISTLKDPRSKDASQRYHAHQYTNGTTCDLTNQPRETEVRFVCAEPRAMISSITELSTCKYALTVQCPTLCKHPLFQEERPVWHTINCNVLPKDYKDTKVVEESKEQIVMVTDNEAPSKYDSEE
uniref:MRH domain-containing protein n=1 Tax=Fagus sylvatica TaxID=28930 RepID=A0A2N9J5V0_FAGSY